MEEQARKLLEDAGAEIFKTMPESALPAESGNAKQFSNEEVIAEIARIFDEASKAAPELMEDESPAKLLMTEDMLQKLQAGGRGYGKQSALDEVRKLQELKEAGEKQTEAFMELSEAALKMSGELHQVHSAGGASKHRHQGHRVAAKTWQHKKSRRKLQAQSRKRNRP